MGLYRRGKIYYMDFVVDGRRTAKSTGKKTLKEAQEIEKEAKQAVIHNGMSLSEAIDKVSWEAWAYTKTGEMAESRLRKICDILGNPSLKDIDERTIDKVKQSLRKQGLTGATINRYMSHWRRLMNLAYRRWRVIEWVPVFDSVTETNGRIKVFSKDEEMEIDRCLRSWGKYRQADCFLVLADTGMRSGEACAITYTEHIDFGKEVIRLTPDITKNSKPRVIPMTKRVRTILAKYKEDTHPFPWTANQLSKMFARVREFLGVYDKNFVVHTYRHTTASRLIEKGVDLYTVKEILGHSSIKVTERYAHMNFSSVKNAISTLED